VNGIQDPKSFVARVSARPRRAATTPDEGNPEQRRKARRKAMKLIPWHNRSDLTTIRNEFDNLWSRFLDNDIDSNLPPVFGRGTFPPVNVAETEKSWSVSVELPGLSEKDIQVQILGQQLLISGERKWDEEKKGKEFHRVESQYGAFQRSIQLPENTRLEPDGVVAIYKKGILEITLPKVEPTPAAKIPVKAS
jgi:HSP20 family protein